VAAAHQELRHAVQVADLWEEGEGEREVRGGWIDR
jgi:hypothetical protein